VGIGLALILRLGLLGTVAIIVQLTEPVFSLLGHGFSWRDLILLGGGLFLVWKATKEIHHNVDPDPGPDLFDRKAATLGFGAAIGQILILDLVFSIDSIVTAVGMTNDIPIMVIAVLAAVAVMLLAANPLANFIAANPSVVMLALGFLLMIGMALIAEGFGTHVPRGYIYAAMAFSAAIEGLNMLSRRARKRRGNASRDERG
jgi:predicted tellurium resistance membrane protein TerC